MFFFQPLAGSDYLQIAQYFHTVLIRNLPQLNLSSKSQARRFITLVDTLYDSRVRVCRLSIDLERNISPISICIIRFVASW